MLVDEFKLSILSAESTVIWDILFAYYLRSDVILCSTGSSGELISRKR